MKKSILVLAVILCIATVFAATDSTQSVTEKFSYILGANIYADYAQAYGIDAKNFSQGALDYASGKYSISDSELNQIVQEFTSYYNSKIASDNLAYAESFLAKNKQNKDVVTTKSGLQYIVNEKGNGGKVKSNATVSVYYTLTLPDGTIADQCVSPSDPASFSLSSVVKGFAEACTVAPIGSKITAWLHPDLGYGANGAGFVVVFLFGGRRANEGNVKG